MNRRAFLLGFALTLAFGALGLLHAQARSANEADITAYCEGFGTIQSALLYVPTTPGQPINLFEAHLTAAQIAGVAMWDADQSIWRGYGSANPLGEPSDIYAAYNLALHTTRGQRLYEIDLSPMIDPAHAYILAFASTAIHGDANGNFVSYHPCRAFRVPIADVTALTGLNPQQTSLDLEANNG